MLFAGVVKLCAGELEYPNGHPFNNTFAVAHVDLKVFKRHTGSTASTVILNVSKSMHIDIATKDYG